jgi:hypothetical protein
VPEKNSLEIDLAIEKVQIHKISVIDQYLQKSLKQGLGQFVV